MYAICCKLANVTNYAFFGVIFCLKTVVTYSFWQISRLCYCAYCLKFNCYSLACIACLRNIHLHILQNARVAVLPLESTCNAAHHRHVKGISKGTLQQRTGVSNFANNILSVSSQARQELNPSQVTAYLRIKREPPEVEDTCISGDSSQGDLQSR